MRAIRVIVTTILFAGVSFLPLAQATSFTTDQGDAWAVPSESGWGMLSAQVGSVMFGTIYVYDPTTIPIWYSATLTYAGNFVWTGDLYLTNGPWFGTVPFSGISYRRVGTMTWTAQTVTTGQLRYDVDGVSIVKNNVTRLFMGYDNFGGHFVGGVHTTTTGCMDPSDNGTRERLGTINITQNGQAISIAFTSITALTPPTTGNRCELSGTLTQAGQMASATGTFACDNGETGTFQFFESQVTMNSFSTQITAHSNTRPGCTDTGYAVGMRATTF